MAKPSSPAAKAGLKVGDEIADINGVALHSVQAVIPYLQENGKKPVTLTFLRDGNTLHMSVPPKWGGDGEGKMGYRLGVGFVRPPFKVEQMPFLAAARKSAIINYHYSGYILDVLHRLVTHRSEFQQLSGPIGIAQQTGQAVEQSSWQPIIGLTALISLNLALFNLLPLLPLDGGHLFFIAAEKVLGRPVRQETMGRIAALGIALVLVLFVFALVKTFWPHRAVTLPTIEPAAPTAQMDERIERIRLDEARAAGRHHDGVEHDRAGVVAPQAVGDHRDHRR